MIVRRSFILIGVLCILHAGTMAVSRAHPPLQKPATAGALTSLLDAPLLFTKRHSYKGIHIYDTYYKWESGGGIYIIDNPAAPPEQRTIRALIDPTTPEPLGQGMYTDPELSWDATRLLFCFKGSANGNTCIYEIGIDGKGLKQLTNPQACLEPSGRFKSHHDVGPAYLPDGRIIFTSTRPNGLVPCFNSGVDIMHVMNADGTDITAISVNNVNEFDPCVLPDGRILYGRWEYVDKTALTQQSLWTIFPDGTNETALFANNLVRPEALLDARPVPGSPHLVAASLTRHNAPPRGSVGFINLVNGKNNPTAIFNLDSADNSSQDTGNSCEPWPLSKDVLLSSGRPQGFSRNVIEIRHRDGRRAVVVADPTICCHSPMLIKPRELPPVVSTESLDDSTTGRFFVQNIYEGLTGVKHGEVKWLRVIEETSRASGTHGAAYNQTFLLSAALAFSVKNFLGIVPVEPDGSAYFEVPSKRAVYLQALDADGRLIQSMRTFVNAAPGVTRSCIGCHEHKYSTPRNIKPRLHPQRAPSRLQPESWGSGFLDYPTMVQPVLDRRCVRCHGGEDGIEAGLDLSGGWTENFNISYENLAARRDTQVIAHLIAGIDCMNGTALWSAQIFPPRAHGSGAAPLARILVEGHDGHIPDLTRTERDLILAWIDTNGLYYGTWDYSSHGCKVNAWGSVKNALIAEMRAAGCMRCHQQKNTVAFETDWFNLERPEYSRILRAPLSRGAPAMGLGSCRDRAYDARRQRTRMYFTGGYVHHVLPLETFDPKPPPPLDTAGEAVVSFASTSDRHYQAMLDIIRKGRTKALATPRVDMPGAEIIAGKCKELIPTPLPEKLPSLVARVDDEGIVRLAWERSAWTIGLSAEVHRGKGADFEPGPETLLTTTSLFTYSDESAAAGQRHYALILISLENRSTPIRASVTVPPAQPPPPPAKLKASSAPGRVELHWRPAGEKLYRYNIYRRQVGAAEPEKITSQASPELSFNDTSAREGIEYSYTVRTVDRRGLESTPAAEVSARALPEVKEPVFVAALTRDATATRYGGTPVKGSLHGQARIVDGGLDLRQSGHVSFAHLAEFDLNRRFTLECWIHFKKESQMPVVISCGQWQQAGWFLQRIGSGWRWHVGGIDCDGGKPAAGRWTHLIGTYDGRTARLYQDGVQVAEKAGHPNRAPWPGRLHIGQYSAGPGPQYQVNGLVRGVKIYARALSGEDVSTAFKAGSSPAPQ